MSEEGSEPPIRVLVVEDHKVMAQALRALLDAEADIEVVGAVATVVEAMELAAIARPNVILADYRLPDGTGADIAAAVRLHRPRPAVVLLSAVDTIAALLAAVESGARGYLLKSSAASDVFDAVRRAAKGEMLIPATVLAELLAERGEQAMLLGSLTVREREILGLMADGFDNNAVAARLGIRYGTVRSHVRNVIAKLNAHSKMEAIVRAQQLGIIDR